MPIDSRSFTSIISVGEINRERRDLGHHLIAFLKRRHCLVRQKKTVVAQALARELAQEQVQSAALALKVMLSATLLKRTDLALSPVVASSLRRHWRAQAECSSERLFAHIGIPLDSHQRTRATPVRPWPNVPSEFFQLALRPTTLLNVGREHRGQAEQAFGAPLQA